ncbi:HEPN domain-containing protein [Halomonas ventosae]|uniref:HEPN domain-containing protein n=1 Tax=Halomonas ventosae TaxID=229007 RepID=UPI00105EAA98|nr:HEPN domain-containing protein [Halomonas ventosae]
MPRRLVDIALHIQEMDLTAAPELAQHQIRSVVNRAYYAAYLTARAFCNDNGYSGVGASHEKIVDALCRQQEWGKQGKQLQQMKELRHQADYRWHNDMTPRDARKCLRTCSEIIEAISKT